MFSPNKPNRPRISDTSEKGKKPMSREVKRRMGATVALTFILLIIWFGTLAIGDLQHNATLAYVVMVVYFVSFAAVLIAYLAYNRGFVNKDVTVEMLPEAWSSERKQAFVDDNRRRAEASRWMVVLIIPFAIVFMVDALYLFVLDPYFADFFRG